MDFILGRSEAKGGVQDWNATRMLLALELVPTVDLDADHPLPQAPLSEAGARWSARRVPLHVIAETAQHAGRADVGDPPTA